MAQKKAGTKGGKTVSVTPERIFIYILGVGAVGGAIYFAREYYMGLKERSLRKGDGDSPVFIPPALPVSSGTLAKRNDRFPLKSGSRGNNVTLLQQALSNIIGKEAMQKYGGIDGDFGPGTESALLQAGYPAIVSEGTFKLITGRDSGLQVIFNPQQIAESLYASASGKNLAGAVAALKLVRNTGEYAAVNEAYKKLRLISRTIVTDLLDYTFKNDEGAKEQLRQEFLRIGLKNDFATGKWSLSGTRLYNDIITLKDTFVIDHHQNRIPVRKNTILGDEISVSNGMSHFRTLDRNVASVPVKDVKYA